MVYTISIPWLLTFGLVFVAIPRTTIDLRGKKFLMILTGEFFFNFLSHIQVNTEVWFKDRWSFCPNGGKLHCACHFAWWIWISHSFIFPTTGSLLKFPVLRQLLFFGAAGWVLTIDVCSRCFHSYHIQSTGSLRRQAGVSLQERRAETQTGVLILLASHWRGRPCNDRRRFSIKSSLK